MFATGSLSVAGFVATQYQKKLFAATLENPDWMAEPVTSPEEMKLVGIYMYCIH